MMSTQPMIIIKRSNISFEFGCIKFDTVVPKDCPEKFVLLFVINSLPVFSADDKFSSEISITAT